MTPPSQQSQTVLHILVCCFLCCGFARAQQAGGDISGVVKSGGQPLPGVVVTAANTLTGQKAATSTDVDGSYTLHVAANGRYVVRAQFTAFAPATQETMVNAANPAPKIDFELVLASRARQPGEEAPEQAAAAATMSRRGFQSLAVTQGENGADSGGADQIVPQGMPVPGLAPDAATESVAVAGNANPSDFSRMSSDEIRQRVQEYREQQGIGGDRGPGGPGGGRGGPGGPGSGGPFIMMGGRGRGRFDFNKPHGMLFYSIGDSAFDAAPYDLKGVAPQQPGYVQQRFGGSLGGPLNIPKIYQGGTKTFFFLNYTGQRGETPYDVFSTVPTTAERGGIFADSLADTHTANQALINAFNGRPGCAAALSTQNGGLVPIAVGSPLGAAHDANGNLIAPGLLTNVSADPNGVHSQIPTACMDPAAMSLLPYIPGANLPGSVQNFQYATAATSNSNNLNFRLMHALGAGSVGPRQRGGPRNNISIGFHYQSNDSNLTNPFPTVGGNSSTRSFDVPATWVKSIGKLTNFFRLDFNRNRITTQNLYAFQTDITGLAGISGVSQNPFDWGLPNIALTNFQGVTDINPLRRRDQTVSVGDTMSLVHGKHTLRWGGDFRRIQLNTQTDSNARGSFTFTGVNTGFDFADFLVGLPQQTTLQFGDNSYHFRGNSWDLFAQDEWRLRGNLTLNLGLRYEYVSPFTEINNLIANLDISPTFTAVVPVLPGQVGPYSGEFPATLIRPDRNNFAPRVGIAWKPFSKTVVRAGYGINYNTSQYGTLAQNLAFQPPFSNTQNNLQSAAQMLTLEDGFPAPAPSAITNSYAVDPNYRLGYVQIWNLDVQRELRSDLVLNLDYTGTKGSHLDIVDDPNRTATRLLIPNANPYLLEFSEGSSVAHAGSVRLRKRLRQGISMGGTYTFSRSIDNASSIGGGQTVVAQDAFDLAAERGLSSFDQTHKFTADYLLELPFGHDKRWLSRPGVLRDAFGDWQWSGDWTIASGIPFTVRVLGSPTDVNRGSNGSLRADLTGLPIGLADPTTLAWFNTAAFALPPAGQFGDAGRNIVRGPGTHLFNMAMTKTVPFSDTRMLEFRLQANNVFNTPQFTTIDTLVGTPQFGRVTAVGAMRRLQMLARFRF